MTQQPFTTERLLPINAARSLLVGLLFCSLASGCSVKKMAVNKLGNALAAGGSTFASDDDPELVRAAVPFSLKLMESLLAESPKHKGLLFATASGFTQFAYAFVQQDADETGKRIWRRRRNCGRGRESSICGPATTACAASK